MTDILVQILVSELSYSEESAIKVVTDVKHAMKRQREEMVSEYLNCRILFEHDGLHIEGIITDVKVTEAGASFQVTPIAGSKSKWISKFIKTI